MKPRLLSLGFFLAAIVGARADDSFARVSVEGHDGYIVPASIAQEKDSHFCELLSGTMNLRAGELEGLWTPTANQVEQAEKLAHRLIRQGIRHPAIAFPEIVRNPGSWAPNAVQNAGRELALVERDYDQYVRQFVGVRIKGRKLIYCSYFDRASMELFQRDPTKDFMFINDGGHDVWQIKYSPATERVFDLSINGPWETDMATPALSPH